ncbi:MAG TPA: AGE family epimerase/isomerase [Puia sp.]|nr:AGE family epimerase/isomerase [Puia sp.]
MQNLIQRYKKELQAELASILQYWAIHSPDNDKGGFYGRVDDENNIDLNAEKGLVLNARILWAFSAAYNQTRKEEYFKLARRAHHYLLDHFVDKQFGGVFWSVDSQGNPSGARKQIYGQAFYLYALSEYYKATKDESIGAQARELFKTIERHSFDSRLKGYFEAFNRDWKPIEDLRLSPRDGNYAKTMNTHLHLLEAYTNLYSVWRDGFLGMQIENLLEVFAHHFIDNRTNHLMLFFDENWTCKSQLISFGHDIEAAWLLQYAAEVIGHKGWNITMKSEALRITEAASEGWEYDGGLCYEKHDDVVNAEKHWWVQAEAMVGYFNAFQISQQKKYFEHSLKCWEFVKRYIRDKKFGEWHWGVTKDNEVMAGQDKIGFWKCPYHNARACMEIVNRIKVRAYPPQIVDLK